MFIGNAIGIGQNLIGGYSAELGAWLAAGRTAGYTLPGTSVQNALDTFLKTPLETGTVVSRMKTGYIFHAGSKDMAKLNLKDPATYPLTESGTVTFSEGNGCKSAANSYFDQPFKSNEYAGIETDLTTITYVSESSATTSGNSPYGFNTGVGLSMFIRPLNTGNLFQSFYYSGTGYAPTNQGGNHKGLYVVTHTGANINAYRDGNKNETAYTTTPPTYSQNRLILARNSNAGNGVTPLGYYTLFVAVDFLFNRFSVTDELNFRTAFNTYKTAVGLP